MQCLTKDGYDCVTNDECANGACNTFYADQDGDTHGAAGSAKKVCGVTPPAGYVTSNDDCCDVGGDAGNIFKGQTKWFTSPATSCGKGWDYDCSNNVEPETPATACQDEGGYCLTPHYFWYSGTLPACGDTGSRSNCFEQGICIVTQPLSYTQGCH
jgi:hypothetical protein